MANYLPNIDSLINEPKYPLNLMICCDCSLGQIGEFESPADIFTDYPYLSSTSKYWVNHASNFAKEVFKTFPTLADGFVFEIASNDGYLLAEFLDLGISVLGIEPAKNVAPLAELKGINTIVDFFGHEIALNIKQKYGSPTLIVANNVAAHVPDMFDFFSGISTLCNSETLVSIENPTFGELIHQNLYDTIYHEHFSYLSVESVSKLAEKVGLELFKVEKLPTHGGSFRYWLRKKLGFSHDKSVASFLEHERALGVGSRELETEFANEVTINMSELRDWVSTKDDKSIIGYGAAAKTVTTFFAADLSEDKFKFVVDASEFKQGRRLPGTSIPIYAPNKLAGESGQVLIFPWNLESEIAGVIREINPAIEVWAPNPLRRIN